MDFKVFKTEKIDEYARKAKEQWGDTSQYKEYEEKNSKISKEESKDALKNMMLIFTDFGKMKDKQPDDRDVQVEVKELQSFITDHFYKCSNEILMELGKMYAAGGEFTENIDKAAGEGTAVFVAKAIEYYCK